MKIIGLMPVRNESWVLEHSLRCLSAFCDVVLVADQQSDDDSREICRRFPKVTVLESETIGICEQARWQLVDAARQYDGSNLWWWGDADELVPPSIAHRHLSRDLAPGTIIECRWYQLWGDVRQYRDDFTAYRPHFQTFAVVDDRRTVPDRSSPLPLHLPRVEVTPGATVLPIAELPVLHLQWLLPDRNQIKQAWYRCREWLAGDRTAADINAQYSIARIPPRVRTSPVPLEWVDGVTFPDLSIDGEPCWQERDILGWFDVHGPAFFEPLEIWHIPRLRDEFVRVIGRRPRPDRSYRGPLRLRAGRLARRAVVAGLRRIGVPGR